MSQLSFPLHCQATEHLLGWRISKKYLHPRLPLVVKVLDGILAGNEYIYLLHFEQKYFRSQHYLGSTNDLERRLREHQRRHPLFRLDDRFFERGLFDAGIPQAVLDALLPERGRSFRRYHTFIQVLRRRLDETTYNVYKLVILKQARRDHGVSLVMAVNRAGILWHVAAVWQADRQLEFVLKRRKQASMFCPLCQGDDRPF